MDKQCQQLIEYFKKAQSKIFYPSISINGNYRLRSAKFTFIILTDEYYDFETELTCESSGIEKDTFTYIDIDFIHSPQDIFKISKSITKYVYGSDIDIYESAYSIHITIY
mgnify:CR=1 FL=1|uniref:Uncharacterized protein n=1 Tax=viral metagenome TaxID=1070528 RepID=A0A6C0CK04_9ZZZZ